MMAMEPKTWIAIGWLAALLAAAAAYAVSLMRRSEYDFWESCLYLPTYLMGRLVWRVHFRNRPPREIEGGAVLVSNHRSSVDPFFVQLAAGRRVHWMVAKEYCDHCIFGVILKAVQAIPTNRSGMDTASTKIAMRITKEGRLVGMFPEGRLNHTQAPLMPIRGGAALVAARSQVPIIPLFIEGSPYRRTVWSPLFIPAHVAITFGEAIYPKSTLATDAQSQDAAAKPRSAQDSGSVASLESAESSAESTEASQNEQVPASTQAADGIDELSDSDAMILEWGKQVVTMAGHASFPVELVSKRKRRRRS